jgi:serine/threonine-protein kinase
VSPLGVHHFPAARVWGYGRGLSSRAPKAAAPRCLKNPAGGRVGSPGLSRTVQPRSRGLLHRDVKPANILLANPEDGERRILLADFGIARQLGDISGLTATNFTVGTVAYSAPEQLMGADIDGRADQYALATSAYHLLTGAQPYRHSNAVAVISQHLNAAPPKLSDRRSELAHLDQVLSTALAKDPADRFGRCREFATKLSERAAVDAGGDRPTEAAVTVAAPTAGSAQPGRRSAPPPSWMRPAIIIATLVALMVIGSLIFVGIELSRPRSPSPPLATAPSTPNPVTPTLTPVISPPPSPVPPLATTTEPLTTTTAAASGPTLGEPCSDFDKLAYDRNAGENLRTHCVPAMTRLRRS